MSFKYLIEELENFDITDYQDDKNDIIGAHTITNLTFKYRPKDIDELDEICQKRYNENPKKPFLSDIDTTLVTDMAHLFSCYDSEILDLSSWDTSNVEDMSNMFEKCGKLKKIIFPNFNTSNVTDMSNMFNGCIKLQSLDLSNFDTSNVEIMDSMFYYCKSLKRLDLSNFNTLSLRDIDSMFSNCGTIDFLDISNFSGDIDHIENVFKDTHIKELKISKVLLSTLLGSVDTIKIV